MMESSDSRKEENGSSNKSWKRRGKRATFIRTRSSSDNLTSRSVNSQERGPTSTPPLNLTLYGSPAPRCCQRSSAVKSRRPVQPPNTPIEAVKPRKPLRLPIESILILNERLQLEKNEKIEFKLSPRQIKLSDNEEQIESCEKNSSRSEEPFDKNVLSSSTIDLSIDLSSVADSDHETETSSEEIECRPSFPIRTKCSNDYRSESDSSPSPTKSVWNATNRETRGELLSSFESNGTGYPWTKSDFRSRSTSENFGHSTTDFSECSSELLFSGTSRSVETGPSVENKSAERRKSADLIYHYVHTVNNHDKLVKYFRPCQTCKETCCVCFEADVVYNECDESLKNPSPSFDSKTDIRRSEKTDPEIAGIDCDKREDDSGSASTRSDFSKFLHERRHSKGRNDSGTSTLHSYESEPQQNNSFGFKNEIPLSVMQLATAAQCARILANSLESALETSVRQSLQNDIFFQDNHFADVFGSLDALKNHFSEGKTVKTQNSKDNFISTPIKNTQQDNCFEDNFDESFFQHFADRLKTDSY